MLLLLPNEVLRKIINYLDIKNLKKICLINRLINSLNYKYFLIPYKIYFDFFGKNMSPSLLCDEIKDWIEYLNYKKLEYLIDLSNTFDNMPIKKDYIYKKTVPFYYNLIDFNINKEIKYLKVHKIYNIQRAIFNKIKKNNYQVLALIY